MTIGEVLTIYERNHVVFLKNSLGTQSKAPEICQGYFLTLILTGCRRDEACFMQWTHVDLERGLWPKPTTKTGVPHTVPIPARSLVRLNMRRPTRTRRTGPLQRNTSMSMMG